MESEPAVERKKDSVFSSIGNNSPNSDELWEDQIKVESYFSECIRCREKNAYAYSYHTFSVHTICEDLIDELPIRTHQLIKYNLNWHYDTYEVR